MEKNKSNNLRKIIISIIIGICVIISIFFYGTNTDLENRLNYLNDNTIYYSLDDIPIYDNEPYVYINYNKPTFNEEDFTSICFERYTDLDELGRCGVAFANLGKETMPIEDEKRTDISNIKPTGWQEDSYDIVPLKRLYNRCHLIAYSLSAENANKENLITGTRYFNISGMTPFENKVRKYLQENEDKNVLYRVTPIFEGNNLLASGVQIEAMSVQDKGESICFNVYVYNVQEGIEINYKTGESKLFE